MAKKIIIGGRKIHCKASQDAKAILEKDIALKNYPLLREKIQDLRAKLHSE